MSSISSLGSSSYQSPRDLLQQELLKEISSGKISSSDQDALSSALDDIDTSLTSDRASAGTSGADKSSPGDIKSKIDDLITNEVNSGKLTSEQATELQSLFSSAFAGGGAHGAGGPNGAGGPPPGPPPSGAADDSSSTDDTSSTSSTDNITKMLQDFLKSVQDSQSSNASYSSNGDTSTTASSLVAILVDYQA